MKNEETINPTKQQIKKWCEALRSGKYKQTKNELENKGGYCCLGVACMVFISKQKRSYFKSFLLGAVPEDQPNAPKWLKLLSDDFERKTAWNIAQLNDRGYDVFDPFTFDEIADLLELVYIHKILD